MRLILRDIVFLAWLLIPLLAALIAIQSDGAKYHPPDRLACAIFNCGMCGR